MKNKDKILERLFLLQRFGIKPGLERISRLLTRLNNPQNKFKSIHIAGTNGKGSVSSMFASVLMSAGYKVGLYTSPHILRFNERIRVNGKEIEDNFLVETADELLSLTTNEEITFFEITTALAFKYFAENNIDIGVIETGMGGRFDATNVILPIMSIITRISFDHQEYLGNTLQEIAFEKAGIIKKNSICITSNKSKEILDVIKQKCYETNTELIEANKIVTAENLVFQNNFQMVADFDINGYKLSDLRIGLCGQHQIENVQIVLAALNNLKSKLNINENSIRDGLNYVKQNTGFHGRIELIRAEPPIVIDVAHNPDSINQLVDTIQKCGFNSRNWLVVFAAMKDKDVANMLKKLSDISDCIMIPNLKIERALKNNEIETIAKKVGFKDIKLYKSINSLIEDLKIIKEPALLTGSFYLLGEFFGNNRAKKLFNLESSAYE